MRLVTWNACRGQFAKKAPFLDHLCADIAVFQEIARPKEPLPNVLWFGTDPNQGVAVVASKPYSITPLPQRNDVPSYVIPVSVEGPCSFILFAVWTLGLKPFPYVCAASTAIDLYQDVFRSGHTVMLGDFNSNLIWDKDHPAELNHSAMVARLEGHGLVSAYHAFRDEEHGAEALHTFYHHWNEAKQYHIDYCFVPRKWVRNIRQVDVGTFAAWQKCSDHRPLLVDLAIEA